MLLFYVLLLIKIGFRWKSWHELSHFKIQIKQKFLTFTISTSRHRKMVGECQVVDNHTQILPAYRIHYDTGVVPHANSDVITFINVS